MTNPITPKAQTSNTIPTESSETPEIVKISLRIITKKAEGNDIENLAERISVNQDIVTTALKVFISKFGNDPKDISLQSQPAAFIFEIAKIAAKQNGWRTSAGINNYGIEDQEQLYKIARIAAAQSGLGTSKYIQKYGIKDQEQLYEIAKVAAAQNGRGTLSNIRKYGIKDQEQLIEIAKIAALQNGQGISYLIQNYGIEDKGKIIEVMLFCLFGDFRSVEYISNFGLGIDNFRAGARTTDQINRVLYLIKEEPLSSQLNYKYELLKALFEMHNPMARRAAAQLLMQIGKRESSIITEPLDIVRKLTGLELKISKNTFKKSNLLPQILITSRDLLKVGEANRLLQVALEGSAHMKKQNLQAASAIINMGDIERLNGIKTKEDFAVALKSAFSEKFNLGEIENFEEKYAKTFGSYREGNSLMVYYGDVCSLPPGDKEAVMKDLCTFVREVLEGTFSTNRYENSPHLEGLDIDFWKTDTSQTIKLSTSGSTFDFINLLKTKFADRHLPEEVYKPLEPYLGDPKLEVLEDFTPLQKTLVMLMRKGTSELINVQDALKDEHPDAELNSDVQGWIDESNKSSSGNKKYTLAFTADPWDLFRMGSDVTGSCQRVGGDPSLNQGLIGTVIDGKNKLVAIKDPSGKIVARSILRLMRYEGKPVLFIERLYPQTCSEVFKKSLLKMAKEVAARGGVELYTKEYVYTESDIILTSLKSRAYSEYVDAADSIQMGGVFEISSLKKVTIRDYSRLN